MAQVQVTGHAKDKYKQNVKARVHSFAADAGTEHGGADAAPSPHELLLGSLGACTAITLEMYAQRKGWDLQEVTIDLQEEEIDDPNQPGKKATKITREIAVHGNLTQDQVDGLKAIADKCPIHKILAGSVLINTEIKPLTNV
jgi:putative redox protein